MPVSLKQLADTLDAIPQEWLVFIHKTTGEIYECPGHDYSGDVEEEDAEKLEELEASEDWTRIDPHEVLEPYRTMERFVLEKTDGKPRDQLLGAIEGKGAFRRFKDNLHRLDLLTTWYDYKQKRNEELVAGYLEGTGIKFVP